jgi:thiamine-phosphate pyrophosphorylase
MMLHLVTERHRLAGAAEGEARVSCLLEQIRHAAAAGLDVVQLRELDLDSAPLRALAAAALEALAGSRTRLVINERLDVALAVGAHGVHLRSSSMAAERVRQLAPPGFLVGRSVHSVDEAQAAGPVDYLIAGSVWLTAAKPAGHPAIGLPGLGRIVAAATVPVLAIGGVQPARAAEIGASGAAGVAAIEAWMAPAAGGCRAVQLQHTADAFRRAFDAGNMGRSPRP